MIHFSIFVHFLTVKSENKKDFSIFDSFFSKTNDLFIYLNIRQECTFFACKNIENYEFY